MPNNKNALTRIALLDGMLADRYHAYSIQDMTNILEKELSQYGQGNGVTKRCVEKDINYLEYNSPFSVELERYTVDATTINGRPYKKMCLRYSDPTYSIFKKKLTDDEKTILSSALSTLGTFEGLANFEWLEELRTRLNLHECKPVISISKNLLENSTLIANLFTTIVNNQVIELSYRKFVDSEIIKVIIHPYLLKEYNRRWYILAGANDTGKILNFALDRIISIEVKYGLKYKPCEEDLDFRFDEIIGITYKEENPLQKILFWADDLAKEYVRTKPIHGSQKEMKNNRIEELLNQYPQLKGGAFFTIECRENYELIRELSTWGAALIVLTPIELRNTIVNRINEMSSAYKKLSQ